MARRTKVALTSEKIEAAENAIEELEVAVKFIVTDYTIEFVVGKVRDNEYFVPGYQREFIWTESAQARFIESVLIGLPIPFLFLWQADDGRLEIVDGSQRLRTLLRFMDGKLALQDLQLLQPLEGFRYQDLTKSRQRKFSSRVIRGIVLDNSVGEATRTEMFNRINTGGTKANEAAVRRGALPGPMSDLVRECADNPLFVQLTPISEKLVAMREREEFAVRFFTFLDRAVVDENKDVSYPGWKDRPREYIYDFVKGANGRGVEDPGYIAGLRSEFEAMLQFVQGNFPNGFRKGAKLSQVPRVRFEAISVGTGLALRTLPALRQQHVDVSNWLNADEFQTITTSDAANVRAKLQGRIGFVLKRLLPQ
jgi:hypothetical protein